MSMSNAIPRLQHYVTENFLYMRPGFALGNDDSLLGRGIIDSIGVMELVTFVQEEFGVTVEDEAITEENFGTIAAIARFVDARRVQAA